MPKVKLDPAARKPRAASLPVRNHYWRAQPQKTVRAKACKPLSKLAARKQRELPAPRSAIRTLHPVQNLELAPASVKPSAKAAASDATRKEAELQTRVKAALVAPAVGAQLVVKLLRVAHACSASGSSQLPGDWRYDSRTRRGDASSRVLICPCGVKLRSIASSAVEACPQGYYCGFPIGRASPPDPCTKPYNPWLSAAAAGDDAKASQKRPAYGCHLHHQLRLENIARYGVKDDWVAFSQWHDPRERLK